MSCCHAYSFTEGCETAFSVDVSRVVFGPSALDETGEHARAAGCRRVALFTDRKVGRLEHVARALSSLRASSIDAIVYDEVVVEPTDRSFQAAAIFFRDGGFDGAVSVGGGSVMDTAKAALLYGSYPAPFLHYVGAPFGMGSAVPGPLPTHIACPTTCGTGSECTGIAVCGLTDQKLKLGLSHRAIRPALAIVDPACTATLPGEVVAASGFDVLSHALESFTARPYTRRQRPASPKARPLSQGANPLSDLGSLEALRLCGLYLVRAVRDAGDSEARHQMMYAATLAGIAFGNAGVHIPHGMAYAVAGSVSSYRMAGYPDDHPLIPHGVSVILCAPAAFRFSAPACPERHLEAARVLGANIGGAAPEDAGEVLAQHLSGLMREASMPDGLAEVGYCSDDAASLAKSALLQDRLLQNAPRRPDEADLARLFHDALRSF